LKTDEEFISNLKKSVKPVTLIAEYLKSKGFKVEVPEQIIGATFKDRQKLRDKGDILLFEANGQVYNPPLRVEVKGLSKHFTSMEDFPYDTIIIDEEYKVKKGKIETLYKYYIVSDDFKTIASIDASTFPQWFILEKFDRKERDKCKFYVCDKKYWTFIPLVEKETLDKVLV
jgi:hypothetical protein